MRLRKPGRPNENRQVSECAEGVAEPGIFLDSTLDLQRGLDVEELAMDDLPDVRWEPLA